MDNQTSFTSKFDSQCISSLYDQVKNKSKSDSRIILDPPYQRDVVWTNDDMSCFIDSIYRGIVPTNIIINIDNENNEKVCIDGKQRITSIVNFINNKIGILYNENDVEEYIYFNKIPDNDDQVANIKYRVMTNKEKSQFNDTSIPTVKYYDLNFNDQVDIFTRIQKGKKLSIGELTSTYFLNSPNNLKTIIKLSDKYRKQLNKFYDTERKEHQSFLLKLCIFIHKGVVRNLNAKEMKKISPDLFDNKSEFNKTIKIVDDLISITFNKHLFGNTQINKKDFKNNLIPILCFTFHNHSESLTNINKHVSDNQKLYTNTLKNISKFVNKKKIKCHTNDGSQEIYDYSFKILNKITENNDQSSDEYETETDSDSDSDSDSNSDSD
jgi:hypothetical protein